MNNTDFDSISKYILRKSRNMTLTEVQALKEHLDVILKKQIQDMDSNQGIIIAKLRQPPAHHQPQLRVDVVKAYLNGETQVSVAARHNITSVWVGTSYRKLRRTFARFLRQNHYEPPIDAEFNLLHMSEETKQKFLWFLDHYLLIKGYEHRQDVHIPASLKPIDVAIDDTPLSVAVKLNLKHIGFTNMSEVARLSQVQIFSLPNINTMMAGQIIRYFIQYQPDKSPDAYYMLDY